LRLHVETDPAGFVTGSSGQSGPLAHDLAAYISTPRRC